MRLGFPHPDALLSTLTSSQVTEWQAYLALEEQERLETEQAKLELENMRVGLICAQVLNASPKLKKTDWKASDFIRSKEEKPASVGQQIAAFFGAAREKKK